MFQSDAYTAAPGGDLCLCDSPINTGQRHWVVENAAYRRTCG